MTIVQSDPELPPDDVEEVHEGSRLSSRLVYEIVRRDGVAELERPMVSMVWSGIAAGIVIGFSVLGEALLASHLPDMPSRPLIDNLGYSFGFLIVILGRLQLFTENTITTVIPLCNHPSLRNFGAVLRLWLVVFGANLAGTMLAAAFIAYSGAFSPEILGAIGEIGRHMMQNTAWEMFVRAIPAGILIAAIVWMLPSAGGSGFWIILLFTYLIALGEFTHVVAGSTEAGFLLLTGQIDLGGALLQFLGPVFAGNVVGGTLIFTLLAYGQVHNEVA